MSIGRAGELVYLIYATLWLTVALLGLLCRRGRPIPSSVPGFTARRHHR